MNEHTKVYVVNFWQDGCAAVSPGCDNCPCHAPGTLPSPVTTAAARLDKINKHSFAIGGTPHLVFVQDDCDAFSDQVEPSHFKAMTEALRMAQAVNLVISTRYIASLEHRAPAHWFNGGWPPNLGLMVSVSNQREADRDIPLLLALKEKHGIPWVGVRCEPMLSEINLRKLTLQALANPRQRGRQWLDGLTGEVPGNPRHAPKTRFGKLDWVTVKGEIGDTARPIHPEWIGTLVRDCKDAGVPLHFRGWGEWVPASQMHPAQAQKVSRSSRAELDSMLMYRHGGTTSDYPDMLMEFHRFGPAESGAMYRGDFVTGFPTFPRREIRKAA